MTPDFKKYATFVIRINGFSIWWKSRYAIKDPYRFVLMANGTQHGTPSQKLTDAFFEACHLPNPKTGDTISKLTALQKNKIKKAVEIHDPTN